MDIGLIIKIVIGIAMAVLLSALVISFYRDHIVTKKKKLEEDYKKVIKEAKKR